MTKSFKPPSGLGKAGKALYSRLASEYDVSDAAGAALLLNAAQAVDRIEEARAAIERDGLLLTDRLGKRYVHPLQTVEISASKALLAAMRALRLAPGADE